LVVGAVVGVVIRAIVRGRRLVRIQSGLVGGRPLIPADFGLVLSIALVQGADKVLQL